MCVCLCVCVQVSVVKAFIAYLQSNQPSSLLDWPSTKVRLDRVLWWCNVMSFPHHRSDTNWYFGSELGSQCFCWSSKAVPERVTHSYVHVPTVWAFYHCRKWVATTFKPKVYLRSPGPLFLHCILVILWWIQVFQVSFCFWWNPASNYRFKISQNNYYYVLSVSVHFTSGDQVNANRL